MYHIARELSPSNWTELITCFLRIPLIALMQENAGNAVLGLRGDWCCLIAATLSSTYDFCKDEQRQVF